MNKKEVSEIKKLYKADGNIRTLAGCYVNGEGNIISTFNKTFLNIEDDEIYKYLELFRKSFSGSIGRNINTYAMSDKDVQKSLLALRDSELKNEDVLLAFYKNIIANYPSTENYAILLINNIFDVVYKGKDGFKNTDYSDESYNYIHVLLCPVKLESSGLIYDMNKGCFAHKEMRRELQAPVCSVIYPSFEDRSEDNNYITCYTKDSAGAFNQLLESSFGISIELSPEEQTECFKNLLETALKNTDSKIDVIAEMQEAIKTKVAEASGEENISLGADELGNILQNIGVPPKDVVSFKEEYTNAIGDISIAAENLFVSKNLEIKSPDIVIKVKTDKKREIQSKIVDGKKCLVIEIEQGEDIEVNGVNL